MGNRINLVQAVRSLTFQRQGCDGETRSAGMNQFD